MDFERDFPDDAACLDWLVGHLYPEGIFCPKCERVTKHHRVKSRTCYACQFCGHQEYPMKGTIFEDSATSLKLWFHGFFLMAQTRCGISAKQLEREIGVTYKTAWRMANRIRSLLSEDDDPFEGTVEVDEAYLGGKSKWKNRGLPVPKAQRSKKSMILGMAERGSGRISAQVVDPPRDGHSLAERVTTKVLPASTIYTDEAIQYWTLGKRGYTHQRVNHVQHVYVAGDAHVNAVEGFWSLIRRGIGGVYHAVSTRHLQSYLDEYTFRYNHRKDERGMFGVFLGRIEKA